MSKYTPGPWIVSRNQICTADRAAGIATVNSGSIAFKDGEVEANAALIAAAPDLMIALEKMDLKEYAGYTDEYKAVLAFARAAVAKAKGA